MIGILMIFLCGYFIVINSNTFRNVVSFLNGSIA